MHLLRNQVPPTQGSLAAQSPLQSSLAVLMKTKIKTRRYVTELMDVYWVAGLGWVFEVKKGSEVFERPELVLFYALLIYQDLFCICKFFRIISFKVAWLLIGFTLISFYNFMYNLGKRFFKNCI